MNSQSIQNPDFSRVWKRAPFQFLALGVVILALAIIGLTWYAYPRFRQQTAKLADLANLSNIVNRLGDRMDASDAKLQSWTNTHQQLRDQLIRTEQRLIARITREGKEGKVARSALDAGWRGAEAQLENRIQGIQTRVAQMESAKRPNDPRVANYNLKTASCTPRGEHGTRPCRHAA